MTNLQSGGWCGCPQMNRDRYRIFSARNMKSGGKPRERYWDRCVPMMKVGGSRGWNVYNGSGLLSLLALTLLCGMSIADPNTCTLGSNTTRKCPHNSDQENFVVEYESSNIMNCDRVWSETYPQVCGDDASELVLVVNNETLKPDMVYDRNKDLIQLNLKKLAPSIYTYECRLKSNNSEQYEILMHGTIAVGFKPKRPRSFKCISYHWKRLICTWEPVPNAVPTRFSLRFEPHEKVAGRSSVACPKSQNGGGIPANSCLWDASTNPPYRRMEENYTFALDAENDLGTDSFTYSFHHWAHVVPSPPVYVSILDTTYTNVQMYWRVPVAMHDFPPGLHHRVSYQKLSDGQETWHAIDVTNEAHATEIYFKLPDLEGPDTRYRVRVSMKSSMADDEDLWSEFSSATFRTSSPALTENVKIAIEQSFSNGKNFTEELMKQREEAFDRTMDRIEGKLNSSITDSVNQVSNLKLTVSALEAKLDSVLKEISQLRKNLTQCCFQESMIGQNIDIH